MPLYDYKCASCDYSWEAYFQMENRNKPIKNPCPECGKESTVIRIYDTGGFIDPGILQADKNMEKSGVQQAIERIKKYHPDANMKWRG